MTNPVWSSDGIDLRAGDVVLVELAEGPAYEVVGPDGRLRPSGASLRDCTLLTYWTADDLNSLSCNCCGHDPLHVPPCRSCAEDCPTTEGPEQ